MATGEGTMCPLALPSDCGCIEEADTKAVGAYRRHMAGYRKTGPCTLVLVTDIIGQVMLW